MRLLLLFLLVSLPAWAQTPDEWRYLYSRQEAEAVLGEKAQSPRYNRMGALGQREYMTAEFHAEYAQWQRGLEEQLRVLVGPVALPADFARAGTLNLDLCCYRRGHMLDGLSFLKNDEAIVVTTRGLLAHWLKSGPDPKPGIDDPSFYQWTGASDWSVLKARDLDGGAILASGGPESDFHWIALTATKGEQVIIAFVRAQTNDPAKEATTLKALLTGR